MSATYDPAWDLTPADRLLVEAKRWGSRLRFAVMLLFFRARGRFPRTMAEVDEDALTGLSLTLGVPASGSGATLLPDSDDRTLKRQRLRDSEKVSDIHNFPFTGPTLHWNARSRVRLTDHGLSLKCRALG